MELRDKNRILKELLTKEKQGNNEFIIIIEKTNNNDNRDLEKTFLQHLTMVKMIQKKSVTCKDKDTVIINCMKKLN